MIPLKDDHQQSPPREIFVHGNFTSATVSTVKSTHTKSNPKRFTFDQFSESHATNTTISENESAEFRDAITASRRRDPCRLPPSPEMQRKMTKRMMPAEPTVASTIFGSQRKHRGEALRKKPDSPPTPEIFVPRDTPRGRTILVETVPVSTQRKSTTKCSSLATSLKKNSGEMPRSPENPIQPPPPPPQLASTVIGVVSDTKKFTTAIRSSEESRPKEDEAQSQPGRIVPTVEAETKQHCAKFNQQAYESNVRKTEDLLEGAIDVAKEEKKSLGSKRQSPPGRKFDPNHQCTTITKDKESAVLDDPKNGKDQNAEKESITEEKPSAPKKMQRLVFGGIPLIISPGNTEGSLTNAKYSNEPLQSNISALTEAVSDKEDKQKAATNDRVVVNLLDEEIVTQAPSDENNVQAARISATAQMVSDLIPCADLDFFPCCLRQGGVCYD